MPRYVVLRHDCSTAYKPGVHWDFMLEAGETLRTWSLPAPPDAAGPLAAQSLPDHRPAYLDYEGPVSGDRGSVSRWDQGEYATLSESPNQLMVQLAGSRLRGRATLSRESEAQTHWQFEFRPDGQASPHAAGPLWTQGGASG